MNSPVHGLHVGVAVALPPEVQAQATWDTPGTGVRVTWSAPPALGARKKSHQERPARRDRSPAPERARDPARVLLLRHLVCHDLVCGVLAAANSDHRPVHLIAGPAPPPRRWAGCGPPPHSPSRFGVLRALGGVPSLPPHWPVPMPPPRWRSRRAPRDRHRSLFGGRCRLAPRRPHLRGQNLLHLLLHRLAVGAADRPGSLAATPLASRRRHHPQPPSGSVEDVCVRLRPLPPSCCLPKISATAADNATSPK